MGDAITSKFVDKSCHLFLKAAICSQKLTFVVKSFHLFPIVCKMMSNKVTKRSMKYIVPGQNMDGWMNGLDNALISVSE